MMGSGMQLAVIVVVCACMDASILLPAVCSPFFRPCGCIGLGDGLGLRRLGVGWHVVPCPRPGYPSFPHSDPCPCLLVAGCLRDGARLREKMTEDLQEPNFPTVDDKVVIPRALDNCYYTIRFDVGAILYVSLLAIRFCFWSRLSCPSPDD